MNNVHILLVILTASLVTIVLRVLPFMVFRNHHTPAVVLYLGKVLPYAIMAMLVVYCLRNIDFSSKPFGTAEIIATSVTGISYIYKRNTLLSVLVGTVCYMVLIQTLFL